MKKAFITTLVLCALPALCSAADVMRDGYWEMTSTMEMPGMPMQMPPTKIKHCYTKEEVKDPTTAVNTDKNCKVTDLKHSGNKVTWKMKCTGERSGEFSGDTVFKKDSYVSNMKMSSEGMTIKMQVNAKRLGDCPK
jgi:hypothetical protein